MHLPCCSSRRSTLAALGGVLLGGSTAPPFQDAKFVDPVSPHSENVLEKIWRPPSCWAEGDESIPTRLPLPEGPLVPGERDPKKAKSPVVVGSLPLEDFEIHTSLGRTRILENRELAPLQQPLSPLADREVYYAPWMFGSWNVTATLRRKTYPFGTSFVPSSSLLEGSPRNRIEAVGDSTSYEVHYFSTLPDDVANKVTVNLGLGVPKSKVIADRSFNAKSMSAAYRQLTPVQEVQWDPRVDPARLTFSYGAGPLTEDMRPLGQRRSEIYITARQTAVDEGGTAFCAAERSRSVTVAPGNVVAADSESITEFQYQSDDIVTAVSRLAVYLTPNPNSREGVLWQEVGGKAVAFFDYTLQMQRLYDDAVPSLDGNGFERRACVTTPKDVIQCA